MKKTIYILSVLVVSVLFTNTTFAYNYYTDNSTTYSNEQFRRDVKSYLDDQTTRQQNQDLLNTINAGYANVKTQFEIDQMQKKLDEAKQNYDDTSAQIKQVQELINQQNQIMIEQKKLRDLEQKEYEYKNSVCKEVEAKYPQGVMQSLVDNCAKYGVYLKVEVAPTALVPTKINTKKVQKPAFLDEQVEIQRPDILNEKTVPAISSTTMQNESVVKKSLYRKTIEKIKSFFIWW